jgi:prevent-host-death family protein
MTQVLNATKAKTHFGEVLMNSIKEPIIIEKNGRKVSAIISYETFQQLEEYEASEDAILGKLALEAEEEGYLTASESKDFLEKLKSKSK